MDKSGENILLNFELWSCFDEQSFCSLCGEGVEMNDELLRNDSPDVCSRSLVGV